MLWLQLARVGTGGLATLLLGAGLGLSTDQAGHAAVTYLGFYGAGALLVALAIWLSFVIHGHKQAATAATPRTRPLQWGDLKTMRVPTQSEPNEQAAREAKRRARHIHAELDANRKTVNDALDSGYWWNVNLEGLQSGEWAAGRDLLADEAPAIYDALSSVYVLVDAMNRQANNHAQGGHDDFDAAVAKEMRTLRARMRTAMNTLSNYVDAT